jgi:hypothetical protein
LSNNLTINLGEEKKKKFSEEKLKELKEEINNNLKSPDKISLQNIKQIAFFKEAKNSMYFKEIKSTSIKYNTKEAIKSHFYNSVENAKIYFTEKNLNQMREGNESIRLLKFGKDAKVTYLGETKKLKEFTLPTVMEGFGLFKNEKSNELFLGFFKNDNFNKGIWVKDIKNIFIGEFTYGLESNANEISLFSGLMVNFADDDSVSLLFGNYNLEKSTFDGLSLKNDGKAKEIQFDAGVFHEGKKNSDDFYTVKFSLDEDGNISSFKIVYADYEKDEPKDKIYIQDEFSLIKMNPNNKTFYSELYYDDALIYRGDFKVADMGDFVPIFDGEGTLLDCESGLKYSGQFKEGKKQGKGVLYMEFSNDENHENDISNNKNISQRIFEGEFDNDNFVKGSVKENGRLIIENGEFDESLIIKRGTVYYENEEFYSGEFSESKRNGEGTYRFENKYEYHGNWKNGMKDGIGTLFFDERQKRITGNWTENKLRIVTDTTIDVKEE